MKVRRKIGGHVARSDTQRACANTKALTAAEVPGGLAAYGHGDRSTEPPIQPSFALQPQAGTVFTRIPGSRALRASLNRDAEPRTMTSQWHGPKLASSALLHFHHAIIARSQLQCQPFIENRHSPAAFSYAKCCNSCYCWPTLFWRAGKLQTDGG